TPLLVLNRILLAGGDELLIVFSQIEDAAWVHLEIDVVLPRHDPVSGDEACCDQPEDERRQGEQGEVAGTSDVAHRAGHEFLGSYGGSVTHETSPFATQRL